MGVHSHSLTSPLLRTALRSNLPYSINLVYRTTHPNQSPHAHVLATFDPSAKCLPRCWAAAYLDRSARPETEMWIFAPGTTPGHDKAGAKSSSNPQGLCVGCKEAVLLILDHIAGLPIPPLRADNKPAMEMALQHKREYPTPDADGHYSPSPGTFMRHLLEPSVLTLGSCHHLIAKLCLESNMVRKEFPGLEAELNKFLFRISDLPVTRDLPQKLQWGEMREQDVAIVQERTHIPRPAKTLLSLKSVGVFEKGTDRAVAWTFLGLDGSLTTLHTEPEYRGKGIAKAVAAKIIKEHAPDLAVDDNGDAWSHACVYVGNTQSESVCRSLGGRPMWKEFWLRIDFNKAG